MLRSSLLSFLAGGIYGVVLFAFGVRVFDELWAFLVCALGAGGIGAAIGVLWNCEPIDGDEPVRRARAERSE